MKSFLYFDKKYNLIHYIKDGILDLSVVNFTEKKIYLYFFESFKEILDKFNIQKIILPNRSKIFIKFINFNFDVFIESNKKELKELDIIIEYTEDGNSPSFLKKTIETILNNINKIEKLTLKLNNFLNNFFIKKNKINSIVIEDIKEVNFFLNEDISDLSLKNVNKFNFKNKIKIDELKLDNVKEWNNIINNIHVKNIELIGGKYKEIIFKNMDYISISFCNIDVLLINNCKIMNLYKTNIQNFKIINKIRKIKNIIGDIFESNIENLYIKKLKTVMITSSTVNYMNMVNNTEIILRNNNFKELKINNSNYLSFFNKNQDLKIGKFYIKNIKIFLIVVENDLIKKVLNNFSVKKIKTLLFNFSGNFELHEINKDLLFDIYQNFLKIKFDNVEDIKIKHNNKLNYSVEDKNNITNFFNNLLLELNDKNKLKFNVIKWFVTYTNDRKWIEDNFKNEDIYQNFKQTINYKIASI